MVSIIPIVLKGVTLGERHRYLNALVSDAYEQKVPFEKILDATELSPIDRLFKIDLAAKYRHLDYIMENLKCNDMLYVSRALKCHWLLDTEHSHVFNPTYLENTLFPEMLVTAVNKMLHFIQNNLKDTDRCEKFYNFYVMKKNNTIADKFLLNCSGEFISKILTSADVLSEIKPKHFKIICEKYPKLIKMFFDKIEKCEKVAIAYSNNDKIYIKNAKNILKYDADTLLDVIERYFDMQQFQPLRPTATKYIMQHHKNRFNNKPELYTAYVLDLKTLGKYLNETEIIDLIKKLARAKYLESWFSYKAVEPLLKRLGPENRQSLKDLIFVDKNAGEKVENWPYTPPHPPVLMSKETHVFNDSEDTYYLSLCDDYDCLQVKQMCCYRSLQMRRSKTIKRITMLDQLFEQYRFMTFEKTFLELRKAITAESLAQNRQYMMLVLVSKTGGQEDRLRSLMQWLIERHSNEPSTVRATVVRSLVRRAFVWRTTPGVWDMILKFSRDLGLDGNPATTACDEGLHAVVLRNMLLNKKTDEIVCEAFFKHFSTLVEYSLNGEEKKCVRKNLPTLLLHDVKSEGSSRNERLSQLLEVLKAYSIRVSDCDGALAAIISTANNDAEAARPLLQLLYKTRVARRELFNHNFAMVQTNESYLNALRHDPSILRTCSVFEELIRKREVRSKSHEGFFKKLSIYYSEEQGLSKSFLSLVLKYFVQECNNDLARSVAILSNASNLRKLLNDLNMKSQSETGRKDRCGPVLRANMHLSRPPPDIDALGWRFVGAKAVANTVAICSLKSCSKYIGELLIWRNTARWALILARRLENEAEVFNTISKLRATVVIKESLRYFQRHGESMDKRVWHIVKPLIVQLDLSPDSKKRLIKALIDVDSLPLIIQPEFCSVIYSVLKKVSKEKFAIGFVNKLITIMDETFVISVIDEFICNESIPKPKETVNWDRESDSFKRKASIIVSICGKFLLISKCESNRESKLSVIRKFFDWMKSLWATRQDIALEMIEVFLRSLLFQSVFFDPSYISAVPVFEAVVKEFHEFLPIDQYFKIYAAMHLTILYYKSVRQGIKLNPTVFFTQSTKETEGVEIVGKIFGKYIASETKELISRYFPSIRNVYQRNVWDYFNTYFYYSDSRRKFIEAIVKGIVENDTKDSLILGEYIYRHESYNYISGHDKNTANELLKQLQMSKIKEVQFFVYSYLYCYI